MKKPSYAVKYLFVVLLVAILTTTEMLSAVYSKYIVSSGPVSDSARVAVYEVNVKADSQNNKMGNINNSGLNNDDVNLDAADDTNISGGTITDGKAVATKVYTVVNNSEVAVSYELVVELSKKLPTGTSLSIKWNSESPVQIIDSAYAECTCNNMTGSHFRYTFTNGKCNFAPNADESGAHTITLTFTTENTGDATSELEGIHVTVTVNAVQID